jgi:hypothetical protein
MTAINWPGARSNINSGETAVFRIGNAKDIMGFTVVNTARFCGRDYGACLSLLQDEGGRLVKRREIGPGELGDKFGEARSAVWLPTDNIWRVTGVLLDCDSRGNLLPGSYVIEVDDRGGILKTGVSFDNLSFYKIPAARDGSRYLAGEEARGRALLIGLWPNSETRTCYDGEELRINLWASRDCYVKVYHIDAEKKTQMIFPNRLDGDNFLRANTEIIIPGNGGFRLHAPFGQ